MRSVAVRVNEGMNKGTFSIVVSLYGLFGMMCQNEENENTEWERGGGVREDEWICKIHAVSRCFQARWIPIIYVRCVARQIA